MRRQIVYPGQVPLETDQLYTNRNVMIALGKLAGALFGTGGIVNGLAVAPTQPASLSVQIGAGEIYQLENVDNTAYSTLAADTTDTCVKQGIQLQPVTEVIMPPNTAGYSQCFLIEATFQESDINDLVLPYFNSSNTNQAFNGPAGNGAQQPTQRDGQVSIQVKAGIAAATGTQVAPAVDAGYIGLAVVTVANGQATITAANITAVTSNVLTESLLQAIQNSAFIYAVDTGAANASVVTLSPAPSTLLDGLEVSFKVAAANTGATTLNLNGLGAKPIVTIGGLAFTGGEFAAGYNASVIWNATQNSWVLTSVPANTPAQFDNSLRLATTAFVQRTGLQFSSIPLLAASRSLLESDLGALILCQTSGLTLTLPTPQSLYGLLVNGPAITFSIHTTQNLTITAGAGVTMNQESGVSAASVTLGAGSTITFYASSSTSWTAIGGSGALGGSGMFAFSKSSNGYQILPSGIIVQWGSFTTSSSGYTSCSFPLAFPNGCLSVAATPSNSTSAPASLMINSLSKTGFNIAVVNGSSSYVAFATTFIAIGD